MKTKKKNPTLLLILSIALLYYAITNWSETERMLDILFDSTPDYLLRYFTHRPEHFLYLAALLFGVLFLCIAIGRIMKGARAVQGSLTRKKDHTHDRTDTVAFDRNESMNDHYIKQLDGFLKAGIIDRSEYNQLIRRYRK